MRNPSIKLNKKCMRCKHDCKQFASITILKCPQYEKGGAPHISPSEEPNPAEIAQPFLDQSD